MQKLKKTIKNFKRKQKIATKWKIYTFTKLERQRNNKKVFCKWLHLHTKMKTKDCDQIWLVLNTYSFLLSLLIRLADRTHWFFKEFFSSPSTGSLIWWIFYTHFCYLDILLNKLQMLTVFWLLANNMIF